MQSNCLATIANIGQHIENMDPYTAHRIVYLFEMTTRRYLKWSQKSKNHLKDKNNNNEEKSELNIKNEENNKELKKENIEKGEEESAEELSTEVVMYSQFLNYQFEMINSCLYFTLHKNPNFIYALLYSKHLFVQSFDSSNDFVDLSSNIKSVIEFFENQLNQNNNSENNLSFSSSNILEIIQKGLNAWRNVFFKVLIYF